MKLNFNAINDLDYIEDEFSNTLSSEVKGADGLENNNQYEEYFEEEEDYEEENKLEEIKLYDPCKTREENFKDGITEKYFLFAVGRNGNISPNTQIPDRFSKVVVDLNTIEEHSVPEFAIVDYDCLFGVRMMSFIKYKSNFFTCDERVFFEALLIKYRAFRHKPFFWSKGVIWKEIGVKKDRATKIVRQFCELGILSAEVRKSMLDGRPQQITYYEPIASRIMELIPEIFGDREDDGFISELEKYLNYEPRHSSNRLQ